MDVEIRGHIVNNFKESSEEDIRNSIEESIKKGDDITLPGLGVFFEMLWNGSNSEEQELILTRIKNNLT